MALTSLSEAYSRLGRAACRCFSGLLGTSLAVWMTFFPRVEKVISPIIVASQTIPIIALSPVLIMWLGYTIWSKVAVTVLITFFPIAVNTYDGIRSADREMIDLMRTMGAGKRQIFWKLQVPSALPMFFSGFKIAAAVSVVGATIGEWLGASAGLGYYSRRASGNMQADHVFAAVFLLSLMGIALFLIVKWLEKRTIPWHYRDKGDS